jgi:FtsP/CotA-like multicopper oxidase with cupredoxin domain
MSLKLSFFVFATMLAQSHVNAQSSQVCPRFASGSVVTPPADLFSKDGLLTVKFKYQTTLDKGGNSLFCFTDSNGAQSPTLHVNPGDRILMSVSNEISESAAAQLKPMKMSMAMSHAPVAPALVCGSQDPMSPSSVNVHFHGTNTPPSCHQDEVIRTLINSGETFDYDLKIPANEPPGLYWYHPHVHGISSPAVLGGASGAIIVEGIQNANSAVAGLTQQLLIVRDNLMAGSPTGDLVPNWDLSLNYVPVPYPAYPPAVITMKAGEKQFWRVLNASANTIIDLQLIYDGQAQNFAVVGLDGVPTGSQDGTTPGTIVNMNHILLMPAARAEFIVTGPAANVAVATLKTLGIDTGPAGDSDPPRPIAKIQVAPGSTPAFTRTIPPVSAPLPEPRFTNLATATPTATRKIYFSEISLDAIDQDENIIFFITVDGQIPTPFDANNPPAIVTTQGAVEDWIIENRSTETHAFHIHQIHFLTMAQNGVPIANPQFLDTISVPYWTGTGPYPSVTLRMDFRGAVVGDFVYHCHILDHEDGGMMATIRVKPAQPPARPGRR